MKPISLHPVSLAVGAIVGVGVIMLSAQSVSTIPTMRVEAGPHPRDMMQIREGSPFVVPPGKYFVLTGLGSSAGGGTENLLRVNGQVEARTLFYTGSGPIFTGSFMSSVPSGLAIPWGSTIEVTTSGATTGGGRAWGYLADR